MCRTVLFSGLAVLLPLTAAGQSPSAAELERIKTASKKIHDATLRERHTFKLLRELCRVAPRRLSGSPAAAAAVEWAKQTMVREGLENVRLEPCMVPHWVRGDVEVLKISAPGHAVQRLPILALGGSIATPKGGITAEVLVVETFEELEKRAAEARGKIVLFDHKMDATELNTFRAYGKAVRYRYRSAPAAAKVGALAAVVRSMSIKVDDVPHTGGMGYRDGIKKIPVAAVSTRGAETIAALVARGDRVRLHLELSCEQRPDKPSFNVVGELRGREKPDEIVLVGGHLDSWDVGQGAHDCGAGCCQAINALRLLKRLGLRPRRTLRAVLFMNEENGLRGARAYAKAHADELPKHVLALESDRGAFTPRGFTSNANPQAMSVLQKLAGVLEGSGAGNVYPGGGGADISPLRPAGVVLVGYLPDSQRYFDLHHTAADTLDKINERELELGTAAIATLIYAVAELEQPLPRNPPPKKKENR